MLMSPNFMQFPSRCSTSNCFQVTRMYKVFTGHDNQDHFGVIHCIFQNQLVTWKAAAVECFQFCIRFTPVFTCFFSCYLPIVVGYLSFHHSEQILKFENVYNKRSRTRFPQHTSSIEFC